MRIAVNMESYGPLVKSRAMTTDQCIEACGAMGLEAIELMDALISDAEISSISTAVERKGMRVCSYDVHCDFVNPDPFWREDQIAKVRTGLRRASSLGSPLALVIPGPLKAGIAIEQAQAWYAEALRSLLPAADRLGIRLMVENIGMAAMATYCGRSEHINRLHRLVGDQLGAVYDVGNFLMSGEDSIAALGALELSILHVHFKDWLIVDDSDRRSSAAFKGVDGRLYLGAVLGQGVVNLTAALAALAARSYDGYISVEYEGPNRPDESMPAAVGYLRDIMAASPA